MSAIRGVPVWRTPAAASPVDHDLFGAKLWAYGVPLREHAEPGTWYPVALAEARERVIEAARASRAVSGWNRGTRDAHLRLLCDALAALDALEAPDA